MSRSKRLINSALLGVLCAMILTNCGGSEKKPVDADKTTQLQAESQLQKLKLVQDELLETQAQLNRELGLLDQRIEKIQDMLLEAQSNTAVAVLQQKQEAAIAELQQKQEAAILSTTELAAVAPIDESAAAQKSAAPAAGNKKGLPFYADIILVLFVIILILVMLKIGSNRQKEIDEAESGEIVITSSAAGASASVGEKPRTQPPADNAGA